jgi:hypothetical protein
MISAATAIVLVSIAPATRTSDVADPSLVASR